MIHPDKEGLQERFRMTGITNYRENIPPELQQQLKISVNPPQRFHFLTETTFVGFFTVKGIQSKAF